MSKLVLLNTRLFVSGADFTSNSNKVELEMEADDVDATNFGSGGWKETLQGLISTKITGEGQWEAGDAGKVDNALWAELSAGSQSPWTVCPVDAADGGQIARTAGAIADTWYRAKWTITGSSPSFLFLVAFDVR